MVDANVSILLADAGSLEVVGASARCLPPMPIATRKVMTTGIQERRSYQVSTLKPQKETCLA